MLNSIKAYENFGREIIMHSFSNTKQPTIADLDQKMTVQTVAQISGWHGPEVDLENAPHHLLPNSSLVDAVIGRFDESDAADTPYLPQQNRMLKLNSNNSGRSDSNSNFGQNEAKLSSEFD